LEVFEANKSQPTNGHTDVLATALSAVSLTKTFGRRRVVDDVSLHVGQGEVVGLLGANGAGKTTTFYMLVGLERS
jgi:lipopolysaccharide export system ATP-binding protein